MLWLEQNAKGRTLRSILWHSSDAPLVVRVTDLRHLPLLLSHLGTCRTDIVMGWERNPDWAEQSFELLGWAPDASLSHHHVWQEVHHTSVSFPTNFESTNTHEHTGTSKARDCRQPKTWIRCQAKIPLHWHLRRLCHQPWTCTIMVSIIGYETSIKTALNIECMSCGDRFLDWTEHGSELL